MGWEELHVDSERRVEFGVAVVVWVAVVLYEDGLDFERW